MSERNSALPPLGEVRWPERPPQPWQTTWFQRLKARLGLKPFLGYYQKPSWNGALPFYLHRCCCGDLEVDYPHGFQGYFLCQKRGQEEP